MISLEKPPMTKLTHDEALALAKKDCVALPENIISGEITAADMSCIDDRKNDGEAKARIPGAGLGVLMDTFAAGLDLKPEEVAEVVESTLGSKISYHTDDAHIHDPLRCAGCGHCGGALSDPEHYLLSPEVVTFVKETYLPKLDERKVEPEIYSGKHNSKGVMIINGPITMTSDNENMVYVYHPELHRKAINQIAAKIAEKYELNAGEIAEKIWNAAQKRLTVTVEHLAEGFPQYQVSKNETGEIEIADLGLVTASHH